MNQTQYLSELKLNSGLTLQEIADQSGVSLSTVKKIFAPGCEFVSTANLADILRTMTGSLDTMFELTPEPAPSIPEPTGPHGATYLTLIHRAHQSALAASRDAYQNAYAREKEASDNIITHQRTWLRVMFWYCVSVTVAAILVMFISVILFNK